MTLSIPTVYQRASRHDLSQAAIMARATAFAAESATRWAARCAAGKSAMVADPCSPDDLLTEIRAAIAGQAGAPLPSLSSALANRRAIFGAFDGEATRG